jgi:hypothetical protein
MTTLAIRVSEACEAIAEFDPNAGVTKDQILEIVADLDGWNQQTDGLIELQVSMHDHKVRMNEIIRSRTGLTYAQAPAFYEKMETVFLDRRIPIPAGWQETAPLQEGPEAAVSGASVAVAGLSAGGAKTPALLNETQDRELVARLQGLASRGETKDFKALSFGQSFQKAAFLKDLTKLKEQMDANDGELSKMDGAQLKRVLEHPSLRRDQAVLSQSREHLRNMLAHYWQGGRVRESDVIILRRYTEALESLNRGFKTVPRQLPTVIGPARAAAALASPLRQSSQGLQALLGRLTPMRGAAVVAGVVAVGGLLAFGLQTAAEAAGPEQEKEIEIVDPSSLFKPRAPGRADKPAEQSPQDKVWKIEELPKAEIPTVSVEALPSVPARRR